LIAKMNSVAKNEGFFFEFDAAGLPKMKAWIFYWWGAGH
jgi:hypothetical protein